jgi:hypothetical protein
MEKYKMTSTETMESMFQLQGEIDMLNERVHKLEKMFESKPVKVDGYEPNTKLYWNCETGSIMSEAEWGDIIGRSQLKYVGTAEEQYMSKKDIEITNAQPYKYALDDVVMETFLFHKEARRSRI